MFNPPEFNLLRSPGKVSLPFSMTRALELNAGDCVTFVLHKENIILVKASPSVFKKDVFATGLTQILDNVNRITIPLKIREKLNLKKPEVTLEIRQIRGAIVMREHRESAADNGEEVRSILKEIEDESENLLIYKEVGSTGEIMLSEFIIETLKLETNSIIQFFLRNEELILKEYQVKYDCPHDSFYTGQSRKFDSKGRLVIAKKLRDILNISTGDIVKIELNNEEITLSKCTQPVGI